MADLVTLQRALNTLPSDITLAQSATVPTLITAASRACERWCQRIFGVNDYDEIRSPSSGPQFTGQADQVQLSQFPVNSVARVSGGRTSSILIANTATTTNQRATAEVVMTGDPEVQLTSTGVKLTRVASGVSSTSTLLWATYTTLSALATAINALGNGWTATVQGTYGNWATTELVTREGPLGALSPAGAYFDIFSYDHQIIDVDRKGGVIYFAGSGGGGGSSGMPWGGSFLGADQDITWGGFRSQVRCGWNGGWAAIPDDVQQACVLVVQGMFAGQTTDPRFTQMSLDQKSITINLMMTSIPPTAQQLLAMYRVRSA